jgi:hypothetical protein
MKTGPLAMLLGFAVARGETVYTGSCRGVLEDSDEEGQKAFQDDLCKIAKDSSVVLVGGPLFGRGAYETWITWERGAITLELGMDGKVNLNLATLDEDIYMKLAETIGEHMLPEATRQPVYTLAQVNGEMTVAELGLAGAPLEAGNYAPEIVEDFNFIVQDLGESVPTGRLVILDGPPGTGKTYLIRGLINEVLDAVFVVVPPHFLHQLTDPSFVPMLLKARANAGSDKPIVLILEDADDAIRLRKDRGKNNQIAALLNLSDGLIGQALDLRIVASTNRSVAEIDPALRRPGRLLRHMIVGPLSPEQASEVYERISEGEEVEFEGPTTLAQVYAHFKGLQLLDDQEDEDEEDLDEDEDDEDEDDEDDLAMASYTVAQVYTHEVAAWVTLLTAQAVPGLLEGLLKKDYEVASLSETLTLRSEVSAVVGLWIKRKESTATLDPYKVRDDIQQVLNEARSTFFSIVVAHIGGAGWTGSNLILLKEAPPPPPDEDEEPPPQLH